MTHAERFFWLVGLLEGEGTFYVSKGKTLPTIEVEMVDADVIERVAALLDTTVTNRTRRVRNAKGALVSRLTYRTVLRGYRAYWLLHRLKPYVSARRKVQMDKAIAASVIREKGRDAIDLSSQFPLGDNKKFSGAKYADPSQKAHASAHARATAGRNNRKANKNRSRANSTGAGCLRQC